MGSVPPAGALLTSHRKVEDEAGNLSGDGGPGPVSGGSV